MNNQFEYIDWEEKLSFVIEFLPPSEKKISFVCRYLTSAESAPPLYVTTVDYNSYQILWNTIKVGSSFFSDDMKKHIDKLFKLKMWW